MNLLTIISCIGIALWTSTTQLASLWYIINQIKKWNKERKEKKQ